MERGQSKAETSKEHLDRNDFIIKKQRVELERIEAERQHNEHQIDLAEQELKQVKSEIRTDKLKSVATDAATALASGVSSLFGSGAICSLKQDREGHFDLNIDGVSRHSWFRRKKDEFMEALGLPTSKRSQNRGLKL